MFDLKMKEMSPVATCMGTILVPSGGAREGKDCTGSWCGGRMIQEGEVRRRVTQKSHQHTFPSRSTWSLIYHSHKHRIISKQAT